MMKSSRSKVTDPGRLLSKLLVASMVAMIAATIHAAALIASQVDTDLFGMPIVTADGETIGYVVEVNFEARPIIVIGEIVRPFGVGYEAMAIPIGMLTGKDDHVQLAITFIQVRSQLRKHVRNPELKPPTAPYLLMER